MMAMLGFGASCSTTRQQKLTEQPEEQPVVQQDTVEVPQIRLMYGPPPAVRIDKAQVAPEEAQQPAENPLKVIDNE